MIRFISGSLTSAEVQGAHLNFQRDGVTHSIHLKETSAVAMSHTAPPEGYAEAGKLTGCNRRLPVLWTIEGEELPSATCLKDYEAAVYIQSQDVVRTVSESRVRRAARSVGQAAASLCGGCTR